MAHRAGRGRPKAKPELTAIHAAARWLHGRELAVPVDLARLRSVISESMRRVVRERLSAESGRIDKDAPLRVALAYPSPYTVAMSSLGYQRIYRAIQALPGVAAERVFLPDGGDRPGAVIERPVSYESLRELGEFPLIAWSVAYEVELAGLLRMLDASGIPALREERSGDHPLLLAGGPLTFSNPLTLAPFCDAIVLGEAEEIVAPVIELVSSASSRAQALEELARQPHVYVPEHHGDRLPSIAACSDALLPAWSAIRTPHTELSSMFLIETERGCSRGCTYCVMRRTTNGGMRVVPKEVVLEAIPHDARRIGLVGAAVSDHPKILEILNALADRGCEVGLSSLRPDRLKDPFIEALRRAGYRTLTTALDGASQRLRDLIERRGREEHYLAAAESAKRHGMDRMKLYLMLGVPTETDEDVDECARFVSELSRVLPVALGIAPFCAKRNTPLDGMPFAGIDRVERRLARLQRGLKGRADVRAMSARWAWVEYVLSQGGAREGRAVAGAVRAGGRFADFRRAFEALGHRINGAPQVSTVPIPAERLKRIRRPVAPIEVR
jgi:radical SAM superfamily enzyme YgiQ (UPF0313 family)